MLDRVYCLSAIKILDQAIDMLECAVLLQHLDTVWKTNVNAMAVISMRADAQKYVGHAEALLEKASANYRVHFETEFAEKLSTFVQLIVQVTAKEIKTNEIKR